MVGHMHTRHTQKLISPRAARKDGGMRGGGLGAPQNMSGGRVGVGNKDPKSCNVISSLRVPQKGTEGCRSVSALCAPQGLHLCAEHVPGEQHTSNSVGKLGPPCLCSICHVFATYFNWFPEGAGWPRVL